MATEALSRASIITKPPLPPCAPPLLPVSTPGQAHDRSSTLLRRLATTVLLLALYAVFKTTYVMSIHHNEDHLSQHTDSIFLPFVYKFSSKHVPQVMCTIEGAKIEMPVDTGSTGVLIGAPILPNIDPSIGEPAHHFFTSSRILYVGRLVKLSIKFEGDLGSYATARVPVLIVDKSWWCPWYNPMKDGFECPPGPHGEKARERDTSRITYMGVGFGRNCPRDGMPIAAPEVNPFLNIEAIDGLPLSTGSMQAGYIVTTAGVTLGLTSSNTRDFVFEKLQPGCAHSQDSRDWAMAQMCFSINGRGMSNGSALVDTGIAQMYIRAEEGVSIPYITIPNPNPKGYAKMVRRVKPGTEIAVGFPSLNARSPAYSFTVGDNSSIHPTHVIPEKAGAPAFVNTGRNFIFGFSIAFDAIGGRFGFRPAKTSSCASL